jgi:hypothetical protein
MLRASDALPVLIAAWLLRGNMSPGKAEPPQQVANALEVPRVQTGGNDPGAWFAQRFALALEVLRPNVPDVMLRPVALSILSQWAHETNRGKSEFNFNLGGWRARQRDQFFTARDVQTGPQQFRWTAYNDLPNAVADQLQRLHDRFPTAWAKLVANPLSSAWIEELGRKGYYVAPPGRTQEQHQQAYARAWAMQRAELGRLAA